MEQVGKAYGTGGRDFEIGGHSLESRRAKFREQLGAASELTWRR
jgi:hypothetical protein